MKKYYVVCRRKLGIFDSWNKCKDQVEGYRGARYKSFEKLEPAVIYIEQNMPGGECYILKINGEDNFYHDYIQFIDDLERIEKKGKDMFFRQQITLKETVSPITFF